MTTISHGEHATTLLPAPVIAISYAEMMASPKRRSKFPGHASV